MTSPANQPRGPELRRLITECLTEGMERALEISARVNAPRSAVSARLNYMRSVGLVTSCLDPENTKGGLVYLWKLVPQAQPVPAPAPPSPTNPYEPPVFLPQETRKNRRYRRSLERVVVRSKAYPSVGMRDPLVAALFGAPAAPERNHP